MPKSEKSKHKPVLLHESIEALDLEDGETFLDATYGGGGHSREVQRLFPQVEIIAIDQDPEVGVTNLNFMEIDKAVDERKVNAILFDLGFSSDQIEGGVPGLSFLRDEPLDMRLSRKGPTAKDILNSWTESAIELILRGFGEERSSRKIAGEIVRRRKEKPFETTFDLVDAVRAVKEKGRERIHPATKTFQALRIAVNEELTALEVGLEKSFELLDAGGRLVVISFHSLEDRMVKRFFRDKEDRGLARRITKKPITPSEEETDTNPRARSAKLRALEKTS